MTSAQPLVSIIIPMHNEKNYIDRCINTLANQSYPLDKLEIIVVDGQSTDGSREIVEELGKAYPVKLLDNPKGFTPTGMNIGLKAARGEFGVIFSAHATAHPDFILNSVKALQATQAAAVGGRLINCSSGEFAKLAGKVLGHPFGVGNSKFRYSSKADYVDTVAYGAYRMDILQKTGLFDERLIRNQDIELNYRIRKFGYSLYYDPAIESYYAPRESYSRFIKQGYGNGYWNIITAKLCAQSLSWRHFIPFVFVVGLLGGGLLSIIFNTPWFFALVALPYLLLDLVVSAKLCKSWQEYFKLLILFPSLHISYGWGSLVSLIKQIFVRR